MRFTRLAACIYILCAFAFMAHRWRRWKNSVAQNGIREREGDGARAKACAALALIQNGFLLFSPRFILRRPNPLKVGHRTPGLSF
jgi:hypothetical protein